MVTCAELTAYWDQAIGRFLAGGPAVPPDPRMRSWAEAYRGRGRGEVTLDAFPEPYPRGARPPTRRGVPRRSTPARRTWTSRDARGCSPTRSGTTAPTRRGRRPGLPAGPVGRGDGPQPLPPLPPGLPADLDRAANPDRRRHGHLRAIPLAQHRGDRPMRPDPGIVREFVWQPIRQLGAPVFAFGKPWFDLLEDELGLRW